MAQGYAGVPPGPLSAYLGVEAAGREQEFRELQGATQIQGMLARAQAQQELQQIKATVAQAGGDPAKASEALLKLGTPSAMKLAIEMKGLLPKPEEPFTLGPGQQRFKPGVTTPYASVPAAPKEFAPPEIIRLQGLLDTLPPGHPNRQLIQARMKNLTERVPAAPHERIVQDKASPTGWSYEDFATRQRRVGAPPPASAAEKASTEGERVSAGYADRMISSEKIIEGITNPKLTKAPITGTPGIVESMAATVPLVGQLGSNVARGEARQKYRQAQEDWVRAKLRKESGAVIADEEMDREIRVYFPQLADTPAVIKQKKDSRKVAQDAMIRAAGRGMTSITPGTVLKFDANGNPFP